MTKIKLSNGDVVVDHFFKNNPGKKINNIGLLYYQSSDLSRSSLMKIVSVFFNRIATLNYEFDEDFIVEAIQKSKNRTINYLRYLKYQTERICVAAVEKNEDCFFSVIDKTENVCKAFVGQRASNLALIKDQTDDICLYAFKINAESFAFIRNATSEESSLPKRVSNAILDEVFLANRSTDFVKFIEHLSVEQEILVAEKTGGNISNIANPSDDLLMYISRYYPGQIHQFPHRLTSEMVICAVEFLEDYSHLIYVPCGVMSDEFYEDVVRKDGMHLQYINQRTPKIELVAVEQNWQALQYVSQFTEELCVAAYEQDIRALRFIWNEFNSAWPMDRIRNYSVSIFDDSKDKNLYRQELQAYDTQRKMEVTLRDANSENTNSMPISRKKISVF